MSEYTYPDFENDRQRSEEFRTIRRDQDNSLHGQILYVLYYNYSNDPKRGWVDLDFTKSIYPDKEKFNSELMSLEKEGHVSVFRDPGGRLLVVHQSRPISDEQSKRLRVKMTKKGHQDYEKKI